MGDNKESQQTYSLEKEKGGEKTVQQRGRECRFKLREGKCRGNVGQLDEIVNDILGEKNGSSRR